MYVCPKCKEKNNISNNEQQFTLKAERIFWHLSFLYFVLVENKHYFKYINFEDGLLVFFFFTLYTFYNIYFKCAL